MGAVSGLEGGKQKPGLLMPLRGVMVEYVYLCSWTGRSLCVTEGGSYSPASLHCGLSLAQC